MRREAWIGLAASVVLHGVLAALLLLSVDARPPVMEGSGDAGSRTRVRLVARPGAEGEALAGAAEPGGPAGRGAAPSGSVPVVPPASASRSSARAEVPTEPSRPDATGPRETPLVVGAPATTDRGSGSAKVGGDAPGSGNAQGVARETARTETGDAAGAGTGDSTGAGAGDSTGTGTGDGTGTGTGDGTGTGTGDGSATTGGGAPSSGDDRHARAIATLSSRLSTAARTCYPPAAKRLRLRGDVAVRFCLDGSGRAVSLEVVNSSGSPLLDRAALECVVPRALPVRDAGGCFSLPVRFGE